jgi:RNA polymerase sigma-70 factor (ECF subfamily)
MINETETIKSAQQGQLSAFNQLVMLHQGIAYNVAYRIMGDADSAADATQEAFIKAFRSIEQYQGGMFRSWLMRIVTNTCYDQLRYHNRRPSEALESEAVEADYTPHLIDPAEQPEETAVRHELGDMLQGAINRLQPDQRVVLILSDVEGFSYQEIAEITKISLGTVKSRLNRARSRLRDILQAQELLPSQYRLKSDE